MMIKKVLVVEDERAGMKLLEKLLLKMELEPLCAANGQLALDMLSSGVKVDMVITDYVMPGIDGAALVQAVRAHPEIHHLPVIVVSAIIDAKKIADLLVDGPTFFLPKPVTYRDLREYVIRLNN